MVDEKTSLATIITGLFGDEPKNLHSLFSVFVLSILLLFYKELCPWCQTRLVPALVALSLGNALIAHVHGMCYRRNKMLHADEKPLLPTWLYRSFLGAWVVLFVFFLVYIFFIYPPALYSPVDGL